MSTTVTEPARETMRDEVDRIILAIDRLLDAVREVRALIWELRRHCGAKEPPEDDRATTDTGADRP